MCVNRSEKPHPEADLPDESPRVGSPDKGGPIVHYQRGSFWWTTLTGVEPDLLDLVDTPGPIVKESPAKRVTVVAYAGRTYYIKRYRHESTPLRPYKFLWKRSQARKEWRLAQILSGWRLPIVRHVALGERWSGVGGLRESILITEGFSGIPLYQVPGFAGQLEAFVGKLHKAGVLQRDLHPGNILVDQNSGELRLVDLHGIRLKPKLSWRHRRRNLARLHADYPFSRDPEIVREADPIRRRLHATRRRRCLKTNREFCRVRQGRLSWHVRSPWRTDKVDTILAGPDAALAESAHLIKAGRSTTVGSIGPTILKRYNDRGLWQRFKDRIRGGKSRRAFVKAYHLELAGIPTSRPIAAATRYRWALPQTDYIVMERLEGTPLSRLPQKPERLVDALASLAARLHKEGFSHRDLKLNNFLVDAENHISLIDLEGLTFHRRVSARRARRDLARLHRSVSEVWGAVPHDSIRFLKAYCRHRRVRLRTLLGKKRRPKRRRYG